MYIYIFCIPPTLIYIYVYIHIYIYVYVYIYKRITLRETVSKAITVVRGNQDTVYSSLQNTDSEKDME
jgi:uncharacterized protein involved in tellurium resistance